MNCPKCGSEIQEGHQFCMNCGFSLVRETAGETREEQDREPESPEKPEPDEKPEPAAEEGRAIRRRRAAQAPEEAPETQAPAPKPPVQAPAPAPEKRPQQAAPSGRAQPGGSMPANRNPAPARKAPGRPAEPADVRKYRRGSGKGVLFWLGILILVLAAAYIGMCILMPDHQLTAPAVNLAQTVWAYFAACGNYALWFPIALGAIIVLAVLKKLAGVPLHRRIHAADTEEALELARRVVVAETLAPPQQIYAGIEDALKTTRIRKRYFPKGKFELEPFAGGVPLDYTCGDDHFTAHFAFQRMERAGTRVFLEIIEWQLVNDAVSGRCLQAMGGLEPMFRDVVADIDANADFRVYDR